MNSLHDRAHQLVAIDDDPQLLSLIQNALKSDSLKVFVTSRPDEGLELIRRERPSIVLLEKRLSRVGGMALLQQIIEIDPGIEVILMTDNYSTENAVEAIKGGACDFLAKPFSIADLCGKIEGIRSELSQRHESSELDERLLQSFRLQGMVGRSPLILDLWRRIRRISPHFRTALILGETGSGKELAAKALHRLSSMSAGPFIACNCAAFVDNLVETELFGCVKGAYTGATQDRAGLFEHANGGAILLDEIGELPMMTQAKLLRVLANHEIRRVGSPTVRKINALIIGATHRDLAAMVKEGTFRKDLYYRLAMVTLKVPSLIDRKEDMPLLTRHFIHQFSEQYKKQIRGITRRAQVVLNRHPWPGNIRELEHVLDYACMVVDGDAVDVRDLPEYLLAPAADSGMTEGGIDFLTLAEVQKRYARQVVTRLGNKKHAAKVLGIGRTKLYDLLSN